MVGLIRLLEWQWRAYWRRILRGGTAARSNLVILGLMALAGFARYITLLRDAAQQTAKGNNSLVELTIAGLLLLCLLPVWDAVNIALTPREMARFPLTAATRFGLRVLSRFIMPTSWIMLSASVAGVWPVLKLPHPAIAVFTYGALLVAGFGVGLALADLSATARGYRWVWAIWALVIAGVALGYYSRYTLPSDLVLSAGTGSWTALLLTVLLAAAACFAAFQVFPWMLRHAPPEQSPNRHGSARPMTLFRRELRLLAGSAAIRTAWAIAAALCFYLATAEHPEPDALRVMLGVLAFLPMTAAMNSFGLDRAAGLDRFVLWPLHAGRVIAAKNYSFLVSVSCLAVPLAALSGWRFGWREGIANLFEAASISMAVLAWGNISSVRHPEDAATATGENLFDQLVAMVAIAVPTAVAIGVLRSAGNAAWQYVLVSGCVFALIYAGSLRWSAGYFAANHEQMRGRLT